jgi:hypothetical protein
VFCLIGAGFRLAEAFVLSTNVHRARGAPSSKVDTQRFSYQPGAHLFSMNRSLFFRARDGMNVARLMRSQKNAYHESASHVINDASFQSRTG